MSSLNQNVIRHKIGLLNLESRSRLFGQNFR